MIDPKILVTGATGLIGVPLLARLRGQGLEAYGVSRSASGPFSHAADLGSLSDAEELVARVEPTTIVHLVGGAHGDERLLYELNARTLTNVMHAAARHSRCPTVIALGSAAEYGEPPDGVASELSPTRPVSAYGRAKLQATSLARAFSDSNGVPLSVVRPFNIVSPRLPVDSALGNLRRQLMQQTGPRRVVRCGRIDVVRDFVPLDFVVDVLAAIALVLDPPPVLNVCSGTGIVLADVLDAMASHIGAIVDVEPVPELIAIPAPLRIVGDPRLLAELHLSCEPTPASLARVLLGPER